MIKHYLLYVFSAFLLGASVTFALADRATKLPDSSLDIKLINHEVVDTNGHSTRLVDGVMGNKLVVMNFIYTNCLTVCPVSTHIMKAAYQQLQHSEQATDVQFITLTLNPKVDTPANMQAFAAQYGDSGEGWKWLTGDTQQVNEMLLGLRAYAAKITEHSSVILVGDPVRNHWTGFYQFPQAEQVVERIHAYREQRQAL